MTSIRSALLAALVAGSTLDAQQLPDSVTGAANRWRWPGDSILVVGAMAGWARYERGFDVATPRPSLERATAPSLPRALQGRIPGVSVSQGPGFLGSSSRVWMRGPSSLMVNEPLVIIDGVRTHAASPVPAPGELPSRLEDIDPEGIERVEVLRGAAASAIYGPGASKGVILVTTARGRQGPARWLAFAESGPMTDVTDFPANFGTLGVSPTGAAVANCTLAVQAAGNCTPTTQQSWNPLESASPFRTGWSNGAGVSVTGGNSELTYRAGINHERATGVYESDRGSGTNAQASLGLSPTPAIDVRLSGVVRREEFRHPLANYIELGLRGQAVDDPVRRGYLFDPRVIEATRNEEEGRRMTGSLRAVWRARPWLVASAMVGYDELRNHRRLSARTPAGFPLPGEPPPSDSVTSTSGSEQMPAATTLGVEVAGTYRLLGSVARSTAGVQYLRENFEMDAFSRTIPDDPTAPGSASESHFEMRRAATGFYAQQHFGWRRFFLTGSIRADRPKADQIQTTVSPSVDVSWLPVGGENERKGWLELLRFRAAYGRGGGHLIASYFIDTPFAGIRSSDETAERMAEVEVGADLSLFGGRFKSGITAYRATNDQGLIMKQTPPSTGLGGGGPYLSNDARFTTSGLEASVTARVINRGPVAWDLGLAVAAHDNEARSLSGPPLILTGAGQRVQPGESIGEYHPGQYTFADANDDGLIAVSEVSALVGEPPSVGSPFPDYETGLRTEVSLGSSIRVSALIDRRSGQKLYNATGRARCVIGPRCREQHDPATSLADQAAAVAAQSFSAAGWIEDASYTKLREATLTFVLPRVWIGASTGAALSLSGRNLFTWTSYRGLDPELSAEDRNGIIASGGYVQPPLRSFTARLDLSW